MTKSGTKPIEGLSYEDAFIELEEIVAVLESGEHPLEESLSLFERGQRLIRHCTELLNKAELKIKRLSGEMLEPFQEGE
jgi:exodeoxyribonuclease VII small subunit